MILQANGSQKKVGIINTHIRQNRLQEKKVTRDKDGHYIMTKGTIHQEDITFINIYEPNIEAPKYVKQLLIDL